MLIVINVLLCDFFEVILVIPAYCYSDYAEIIRITSHDLLEKNFMVGFSYYCRMFLGYEI